MPDPSTPSRPRGDRRTGGESSGLPEHQRAALRAERMARQAARDAQRRAATRARRARLRRRLMLFVLPVVVIAGGVGLGLTVAPVDEDRSVATTPPANDGTVSTSASSARSPQTVANGPIFAPTTGKLLNLKLIGTSDAFEVKFKTAPRAGLLFDLDTGRVLWRKSPNRVLPIASVTKMMTALVVVDQLKPGAKIRITKEALNYSGSGVGVLPRGKEVGLSALLHGLLLSSGNDAAIALAIGTAGSQKAFIRQMNLQAKAMGLSCTRYASPSGIVDEGNHSCAADLAVLAKAVLDNSRLAPIVGRKNATLPFPVKGGKLFMYNHNPLLREDFPGVIGVKTGFTTKAGKTFVAAVKHKGKRYGLVLLHSPDIGKQSKQLFKRAYDVDV